MCFLKHKIKEVDPKYTEIFLYGLPDVSPNTVHRLTFKYPFNTLRNKFNEVNIEDINSNIKCVKLDLCLTFCHFVYGLNIGVLFHHSIKLPQVKSL